MLNPKIVIILAIFALNFYININIFANIHNINSINEWKIRGKVKNYPYYTVKQALLDIFCLFYYQDVKGVFHDEKAEFFIKDPEKYFENARKWTKLYAPLE